MNADLERAEQVQPSESKLGVIWAAMLLATVVYAAIAFAAGDRLSLRIDRELRNWILIFLAMASGLHVLTTLLLRQAIAALSRSNYVTYCIVRWALIEGIGIYGLVLAILGVGIGVTSIFFAVALLVLAALRPGATDRSAFVAQFR